MGDLNEFKSSIDLIAFAASFGYVIDEKTSGPNYKMMRNQGGDKIAVMLNAENGQWVYCSNRDASDNGSIIDFLINRGYARNDWRRIAATLREWNGEKVAFRYEPLKPIKKDLQKVFLDYAQASFRASVPYLVGRGLDAALTSSARFKNTFKVDKRGNVLFTHYNKSGLCGFEKKNYNFTGFASGATKGLWFSQCFVTDKVLVLTESAIDALSYHALHKLPDARYMSIGGNMQEEQLALVRSAMQKMEGGEVRLAFDNDQGGEKLADQVRKIAPPGVTVTRPLPKSKDWNQDLKNKLGLD